MLVLDALPELVDRYQACVLLGISMSEFSARTHVRRLLTPIEASVWPRRKRKRGEPRRRGRPVGYRTRLYRRDDVLALRMVRHRLQQSSGGKGSYRSWEAALEQGRAT